MSKNKTQPLLSFSIISYNNEKFIEDALKSALNQNYGDYELIVSDDCSKDNTWDIINEVVKKYKKPNTKVILNKNEKNLGIVRNFQKAMSLTSGKWIVTMAGDDISVPHRMKVIENIILKEENVFAIGTGYDLINERGYYLSKGNYFNFNEINLPLYPGFAAAINRNLYTQFPDILKNIQSEDIVYSLRALETGRIILTNISTVKHRIHKSNVTSKGISLQAYKGKIVNHENAIKTLMYYKENEIRNKKLLPVIDKQIFRFEQNIEHFKGVIEFYKLNFFRKIYYLKNIPLGNENATHNKILLRLKILCESYRVSNLFLSIFVISIKFLMSMFKSNKDLKQQIRIFSI